MSWLWMFLPFSQPELPSLQEAGRSPLPSPLPQRLVRAEWMELGFGLGQGRWTLAHEGQPLSRWLGAAPSALPKPASPRLWTECEPGRSSGPGCTARPGGAGTSSWERRVEGDCRFRLAELWLPQAPRRSSSHLLPIEQTFAHADVQEEKWKPICPSDTLRTGFGRVHSGVLTPQHPGELSHRTWQALCPAPSRGHSPAGWPAGEGFPWAEIHRLPVRTRMWGATEAASQEFLPSLSCRLWKGWPVLRNVTPQVLST